MNFRVVCNIAASLSVSVAIMLYLLPWLLTVSTVTAFVSADAWHQGHSVFARSVALVLVVAALLIWGIRGLPGQTRQIGVSASLSIACMFGVAALAYFTLTGSAAQRIEALSMQSNVSQVAQSAGSARIDRLSPRRQTGPSAATGAAAGISNLLVWLIAGFLGLMAVSFGVSIMPGEKRRRRR